jgi:hypothetical protein
MRSICSSLLDATLGKQALRSLKAWSSKIYRSMSAEQESAFR